MKILLHACCGPCAVFPVDALRQEGHELIAFFYNPNIHPYKEFQRRLEAFEQFVAKENLTAIMDDRYLLDEYMTNVAADFSRRCLTCYQMRLRVAAKVAKEQGCEAFSTTLLVSPYQQHEVIKEMGEQVAAEENIPFYYVDFREGFRLGVEKAISLELYRQPYCGCVFSEKDRYYKAKNKGVRHVGL